MTGARAQGENAAAGIHPSYVETRLMVAAGNERRLSEARAVLNRNGNSFGFEAEPVVGRERYNSLECSHDRHLEVKAEEGVRFWHRRAAAGFDKKAPCWMFWEAEAEAVMYL